MNTGARHKGEVEAPKRPTVQVPAPRRSWDPPAAPSLITLLGESPRPPSRWARRLMAAFVCLALVPLVVFAAFEWRLSSALTRIDGAFDGLGDRPPAATDGSVTMLMLATGDGTANSPQLAWMPEDPTLVSALFVTVSGDRRKVDVDWLPLRGGVLAGVSESAPSGAVAAVESWTARRIDHLAVVEWSALSDLGRDNDVPLALSSASGRGEQQAFLREVLENTLHAEMRKEPWTLYNALHTVANGMAVEEGWSVFDMNRLVFSLRSMRSAQIEFGVLDEPALS